MDNLEKLKSILSECVAEEDMQKYLDQLLMPLDEIKSKWTPFVPLVARNEWLNLPIEHRCTVQLLCIRVSDLEHVVGDYESS